ncbi:uncharacterized protein LOC129571385 isoform X2 [Sitodiplosis mosellana]|uniref:uncharacterized protein LOC129571385 isoform X2 n=1 Tax=Sitodiplosis mosellana TaxID=263140 RepID=UPI002445370C|nr:uncharacterized protein LOC129571385 isoform X2 [Sitodiplosis mosellana]
MVVFCVKHVVFKEYSIFYCDNRSMRSAIRKLEEVRSEMKSEQRLITVASKPAELLPTIGSTLSAGLQYIGQTYGTNEGKWIHLMLNKIMEAAESTSVRTQYDSIRISAKTIGQLFQQMQSATPEDQNSITLDINTKLLDIFNTFHISENAFKKYPHLAIPTLLELTPLMFVVEQLFKLKKPDLLEKWFYSCRLVDLLKKYRTLVLFYRMSGLSVPYSSAMVEIQPNQPPFRHISNVLRKPFNRYGYNETNRDYMECHTFGHCKKHGMKIDKCFEDERIGVEISAVTYEVIGEGFYFDNTCVQQYVELLRLRVEQTFQGSIDILEEGLCTADRRAKRDSTGSGRLMIAVTDFYGHDGFKIFVNDKQIHSFMRWDDRKCSNFNVFQRGHTTLFQVITEESILNSSIIRFELISCHASGWKQFFRDLVFMAKRCDTLSTDKQWSKSIDEILTTIINSVDGIGRHEENGLFYLSYWEQFYEDSI